MHALRSRAPQNQGLMQRIELLPPRYAQKRRARRNIGFVALGGLVVLAALVVWWVLLGGQVADAEAELAVVQSRNAALQAEIDELQRFAELSDEVTKKRSALQTVMASDVDWPSLLTEVAMVVPGEIWLTSMTASAGKVEGATPVGTETAAVRISEKAPFGRIQFQGSSLSMPGVAKWLIRQQGVDDFSAVWLNSATEAPADGATGAVPLTTFDSTLELSESAASGRFEKGAGSSELDLSKEKTP
ncbi:MAG: hypothetical protein M3360_04625 [Actinomycetota bacterium]|nr:hypothetical protein [Actinomycetota bacterium]